MDTLIDSSRETLKLLKISDDSNKNNSDLDLAEITNQRKRKVVRKHRKRGARISSSSSNSNLNQPDFHGSTTTSTQRKSFLIFWFSFIVICWLVTLSYMFAVITSENSRLQVQIKKLEDSTQNLNLPEVFQNWHETSKYLQENQTQINSRVLEYHREIENLTRNLEQLKLDSSKAFTIPLDFAKVGAEVKSVQEDVEQLKARLSDLKGEQTHLNTELKALTDTLNSSISKITNISTNGYNTEALKILSNMQLNYQNLNTSVQSFISTFNEKSKDLNEKLINNSKTLEDLKDKTASMSSHVETMEKDWPSIRNSTSSQKENIALLSYDIEELKNTTKILESSIIDLRSSGSKVNSSFLNETEKPQGDAITTTASSAKPGTGTTTNTKINKIGM